MRAPTGAALLALGAAALAGCGRGAPAEGEPGGRTARATGPPARRILPGAWDTAWSVGGALGDTTLLGPSGLAAGPAGVYVVDAAGHRVVRIRPDGRVAWSFGHEGGGPGEFRTLRAVALDAAGRAWVLDRGNARITILDTAGVARGRIGLGDEARSADDLVPEGVGTAGRAPGALLALFDRERPLARVDRAGTVTARLPFPWKGYPRLDPLASQFLLDGGPGGTRVVALGMGDGFWVADAAGWRPWRGRYVEPVPFPRIERRVRTGDGGRTVEERIADDPPVFAAVSAALTPTRLLVLFGGRTREAGRLLDAYALADGRYLGTLLLPAACSEVAVSGRTVYALTSELVPRVVAWRRREGALP